MKTIILLALSMTLFSCSEAQENKTHTNTEVAQAVAKDVSAQEFAKLIKEDGAIIDVRTAGEFAGGHLENAQNIDIYSSDFNDKIKELDKTKPVYVYCMSGGRSSRAMNLMKKEGFTKVYNMLGGYSGWSAQGLPTTK